MSEENSKSLDLFGIKPIAESVNTVTKAAVDGAAAFLGRICLPASEEFGLLLRDKVSAWRSANFVSIARKAEANMARSNASKEAHAHPRILFKIIQEGSWSEDAVVQDMWAGLVQSSCNDSGDDDSNLIFINLLSNMTKLQAKILKYACEKAPKTVDPNGLIKPGEVSIEYEELTEIAGEKDFQRLDRELDHLRALELIDGGFRFGLGRQASVEPTPLALHMYVRSQGSQASPAEFFELELPGAPDDGPAVES